MQRLQMMKMSDSQFLQQIQRHPYPETESISMNHSQLMHQFSRNPTPYSNTLNYIEAYRLMTDHSDQPHLLRSTE